MPPETSRAVAALLEPRIPKHKQAGPGLLNAMSFSPLSGVMMVLFPTVEKVGEKGSKWVFQLLPVTAS